MASDSKTCHICHQGTITALRRLNGVIASQRYMLYRCTSCGSLQFDPHEHPDTDLSQLYDGVGNEGYLSESEFQPSYYWRQQVKIIRHLMNAPVNSVADVGCRTGDFLLHWSDDLLRVGVEISSQAVTVARNRGLTVYHSAIQDADINQQFDVVSCYAILEHLPDPEPALLKLTSMVADNGLLVIMIPSFETLKAQLLSMLNIQWHMYCPPIHYNFFTRAYLDRVCKQQRLTLVKRFYTSGGMFNPFRSITGLGWRFSHYMTVTETRTPLKQMPIFDHMYSYYKRQ